MLQYCKTRGNQLLRPLSILGMGAEAFSFDEHLTSLFGAFLTGSGPVYLRAAGLRVKLAKVAKESAGRSFSLVPETACSNMIVRLLRPSDCGLHSLAFVLQETR